ncbi:MAG: peptidylprolyl isomerase [Pseudomonadota bacterium]
MRRYLGIFIFILGGIAAPPRASGELVDKIAAAVGDEIILLSEVVQVAEIMKIRARASLGQEIPDKDALQMALMELIDNRLIEQTAQELRISVSQAEIDGALENQIAEQGITKKKFIGYIESQGMDENTYRKLVLRSQILRYKVIGLKSGGPKVTEEDAKAFYNRQTMSIMTQATFKIAHIFIAVPEDADVVEASKQKEKAAGIAVKAKSAGADFAEVAREYSEDATTAESGGVLGKFKHGELPSEIDKALMVLEEGEVSSPVRSDKGFHIIKMLKKKTPKVKPFDEVKNEILNDLINEELNRQVEIMLKESRRNTYIEVK